MKALKILFITILGLVFLKPEAQAQNTEYKVVTIVESIVPMGLGRSRMIEATQEMNVDDYTTERTDGKRSGMGQVKRGALKLNRFKETKLLNFYSGVGINFRNIASNDALIASKINKLASEGWELVFVTSGVEADAGKEDGTGIFITRLYFKRSK